MSRGLSLVGAKAEFFKVTESERKMHTRHRELLDSFIVDCIRKGKTDAFYTVPSTLTGPYPEFNVHEIGLRLVKQYRAAGFDVAPVSADPVILHVRGWSSDDWLDEEPRKPSRAKAVTFGGKKKAARISPEDASFIAHRKGLSRRLKTSRNLG